MPRVTYQPITRASTLEPGEVVLKMLQKKLPHIEPDELSRLVYQFLDPNIVSFNDFVECPLCINSVYGLFRRKIGQCDYVEPLEATGKGVVVMTMKPININTDFADFAEFVLSGTLTNGNTGSATFLLRIRTGAVCLYAKVVDTKTSQTLYEGERCIPFKYGWLGIVASYAFDYDPVRQVLTYASASPFLYVNGEVVDFDDVISELFTSVSAGTAGVTLTLPMFRGECNIEIAPTVWYKGSLDYVIDYYILGTSSGPIT